MPADGNDGDPGVVMSKLRELARRTARQRPQAIGFGRRSEPSSPFVVVVAFVESAAEAGAAVEAEAQALLYTGPPAGAAPIVSAAGSRPVGCLLAGATDSDSQSLIEQGVDFLVFDELLAEAAALARPELGRVPLLGPDIDEAALRALATLEPDAALVTPPAGTTENDRLTVRSLATMRRCSDLLRAPLAIDARTHKGELDPVTVAAFRDAGAPILVVSSARVAAAVSAVASVPPPSQRPRERPSAALPAPAGWPPDADDEDE